MPAGAVEDLSSKSRDPLARCGGAIEGFIARSLESWGRICVRHTWKVFLITCLFAAICIAGVRNLISETETENLWTPRGAAVKDDKALYDESFGVGFRSETIYFKAKNEGNVLTREAFLEIYDFDSKFRRDLTVVVDGLPYNFSAICAKARPTDNFCLAGGSPLEFFYNIETHRIELFEITSDAALLAAINRATIDFTPDGGKETFSLNISNRWDLLAGLERDENWQITKADTVRMSWWASRQNDTVREEDCLDAAGDEISCNPTEVWENAFEAGVAEWNAQSQYVTAYVQTGSSISNELSKVIGGDVVALNAALFLIILYALLVLGKFHPVLMRSGVAFAGVASVGLAIGCCFGLGGWFQVPQTPVTSVLPFILLGIGVDDMFVLTGALGRAPKNLDVEGRIAYMMHTSGTSIFITTLTDLLAFALSTTTSFPALQYFCIWASVGIALDFVFQITFFVCAVVWDEQRLDIRARDCYCLGGVCCAKDDGCCTKCCGTCCDFCILSEEDMKTSGCLQKEGGYLRQAIKDYYAPFITKLPVKIAVILIFCGMVAVGGYAVTQLSENFSLRFFVPDNSPLNTVFDIQDKEYRTGSTSVSVLLDHRKETTGVYLHDERVRTETAKISKALTDFAYYEPDTLTDPMYEFALYIHETADSFPLSPRLFMTPEMESVDWLARTYVFNGVTLYMDTLADDFKNPADHTVLAQGGINAGTWPRLRTDAYMGNLPSDGSFSRDIFIKDKKTFYDVLAHFMTTPQGASMRSYFAPHPWYEAFTDWIEELPEIENQIAPGFVLDKRRELSRGFLNDVNNATARPKTARKFCQALKYFLSTNETIKAMVDPPLDETSETCYPESGEYRLHRIGVDMRCRVDGGECPLANASAEVEIMQGSRAALNELNSPLDPTAYSFAWLLTEGYAVVRTEALVNIAQAIAAVAIVTFLFISHAFTGLLVVINIAMVLLDIVALMWLWDISVNQISIVNLVLAIGLAVDYSAHIAHAFMGAQGTRNERVRGALGEMGADVLHGALSTFAAVVVLSASKSYIFILIFRQFFGICILGAAHGLIFLPVVLSLIGPGSTRNDHPTGNEVGHVANGGGEGKVIEHSVMVGSPPAGAPQVRNSQYEPESPYSFNEGHNGPTGEQTA